MGWESGRARAGFRLLIVGVVALGAALLAVVALAPSRRQSFEYAVIGPTTTAEVKVLGAAVEREAGWLSSSVSVGETSTSSTTAEPASTGAGDEPDVSESTTSVVDEPTDTSASGPTAAALLEADVASIATPAPPTVATTTTPPVPLQLRVLGAISFPWQEYLPGWRIEFVSGRPGYRGATFPEERLIEVYVRRDLSFEDLVHVVAHEIGHALDVTYLTPERRAAWAEVRGFGAAHPWWAGDGASDFQTGAGDWAESFAWWQTQIGGFYSDLAGAPSVEQIVVMNALLFR